MSKRAIISISIIAFILVLTGVLFGAVFCLRSQKVVVLGDSPVTISKEDIISAAGLKNGQSIFMIDKEKAIENIEAKHAEIKVVQIKTTSLTEIEICIRARHKMFYTTYKNNYYILDEELKVLEIIVASGEDEESNEPTNLTHIEDGALNIDSSTMKCDFVGTKYQQKVTYELYHAIINNVKEKTLEKTEYYTRLDACDIIKNVKFENYDSFNKIIITTKHGVKFDIENPTDNLTDKMNICLSTTKALIEEGQDREKSGTIKIYYNLDGVQQNIYIPDSVEIPEEPEQTE